MATLRISSTASGPSTEFDLYADRISQSISGNYTVVRLYIRCYNRGNSYSYVGDGGYHHGWIEGYSSDDVVHSTSSNFLPSGVGTDAMRWQEGPVDVQVKHNSDGTRGPVNLRMTVGYAGVSFDRTVSFSDFPTINVSDPPDAPTLKPLYNISHTGMTMDMDDGSSNGSTITARQYQYSTSSTFSGATTYSLASNGIVTRNDLKPGTKYYWRARTYNADGYSPWSASRTATTLAGAFVKYNGTWHVAIPYVKSSGVWKPAVPYVKSSGQWHMGGN